ncbi:MAG: YbgC/FadM family acyl-CoA thioesterase [Betaproteobacteria bacterium]
MARMTPKDFRFLDPLRVRWAEVDMQRIVFNGHYLMYLDTAVGGYWRSLAMPYHETMEMLGGDLYVRKATLEYLASAHYDERLQVGIRCERIGTSSMRFVGCVFRGQTPLVTSELVYVFADPATQTSRPVPPLLRSVLEAFEAGTPMVSVATGAWDQLAATAHSIRHAVFVQEQGIAPDIEADGADAHALHAVATNQFGMAVGAGRAILDEQHSARIGRMAVLASVRGAGVGAALLSALVEGCRARGAREVMLHAQRDAVAFYARHGFVPRGSAFEEVGIEHQEMVLR